MHSSREKHDPEALAQAECLDLMLHAFMFTLSGIPVLYSGDEIGMENDLSYHNDPYKADDSRYLHRGKMDWNKAELRQDLSTTEGRLFTKASVCAPFIWLLLQSSVVNAVFVETSRDVNLLLPQ